MLKVREITPQAKEVFEKYFAENGTDNEFYFEGMWFRNQQKQNASHSGYINNTTQRRRYLHFYDTYTTTTENKKHYLAIKKSYIVVSNTLLKEEIEEYKQRILKSLKKDNYTKTSSNAYEKNNFEVLILEYDTHPKNTEGNVTFPENYQSIDIVFKTKNCTDWQEHYNRMWTHSTKLFRLPDKRQNPKYETDLKVLKDFLPAQIEMGCGPSIEANIPPLYEMHETYRVQNHLSKNFYFAKDDTLMQDIISNPQEMFYNFSLVPYLCITAKHTPAYHSFNKAYKNHLFVGDVYNNNFDRLVKRFDIPEQILRVYEKETYLPKIKFDSRAKSLICMGCHADRRTVQKQAREQGLKVIFVDPEGFDNPEGFVEYLIEGPQDQDIIFKMTFTEFMEKFEELF